MKKRIIDEHTPFATIFPLGGGRYAMNAQNGIACTLTGAHHYAGNITHPRQGFREMGVLEIIDDCSERAITLSVNPDGSIIGRRNFKDSTIAMQRLQFSSNLGIAFCINAERVPQMITYDE